MSSKGTQAQAMELFRQIALKNVKNNVKNYLIYFLTLTLGVALFYTFNSTSAQFSMLNLSDDGSYLSFASSMLMGVSLFICVIMGFLISYANRFLMRKRKKELGIYITLGIEQKMILKLIQRETMIIGAVSLAAGLIAGIFLSQGLALISMEMLNVQGAGYHFVFSLPAAIGAVIFFGLLFVVMYRVNRHTLKKYKLIDLLYAEKKNEELSTGGTGKQLAAGILGLALVLGGYLAILRPDGLELSLAGAGIVCIAFGTLLLFRSLSAMVLNVFRKNKKSYYRGINCFSLGQIASKMKSTNVSLAVICMLVFLSISSMTAGLGMGKSVLQNLESITPYDATISMAEEDIQASGRQVPDLASELAQKGVDLNKIGSFGQVAVYTAQNDKEGGNLNLVSLSDYNRARAMQGLKPVTLEKGTFLLSAWDPQVRKNLSSGQLELDVNGKTLTAASGKVDDLGYSVRNVNTGEGTAVVEDEVLRGMSPMILYLNINYKGDKAQADHALWESIWSVSNSEVYSLTTKSRVLTELTSTNLGLAYMAIYLGITFMICACVVLALQQMSEAEDNKKRYRTLTRLGVRTADIQRSIVKQIGVHFGTPLALALIHSAVVTIGIYMLLPPIGVSTVVYNICFAAIVTGILYGGYFSLTCLSAKRVAQESVR